MVKIRVVSDPSVMAYTARVRRPRELSPRAKERLEQHRLFTRLIARRLTDESKVLALKLDAGEKAMTIRRRLLKAAGDANVEIAVRHIGDSLFVGLMTPERRPRRGRKPGPRSATTAE